MATCLDEVYGGAAHVTFWLRSETLRAQGVEFGSGGGSGSGNPLLHRGVDVCPFAMFPASALRE